MISFLALQKLTFGNKYISKFECNDEVRSLVDEMIDICPSYNQIVIKKPIEIEEMKRQAKAFFDELYKIHDIKHMKERDYETFCNNVEVNRYENPKNYYKTISPFDLPIIDKIGDKRIKDNKESQTKILLSIYDFMNNPKLVHKAPYFAHIALPKKTTISTTPIYVHEVTHTQTERYRRIIKDYNNGEVLSIFNEFLYAYLKDEDLFNYQIHYRINSISNHINDVLEYLNSKDNNIDVITEDVYYEMIRYIVSTLKAFELLAIYIDDKSKQQKIRKCINYNFAGLQTIETTLNKFKIDNKSIKNPDIIKRILQK